MGQAEMLSAGLIAREQNDDRYIATLNAAHKGEWRHKRERRRILTVHYFFLRGSKAYAHVTRSTSRRTQAIRLDTLERDYEKGS